MINICHNDSSPESFLQYWNDNPILCGGDRHSISPGFTINYLQHTDVETFEIQLLPVLPNCSDSLKTFLVGVLGLSNGQEQIEVTIRDEDVLLAKAHLKVGYQCRYVLGEGIWYQLQGQPKSWKVDYELC